MIPNLIDLMTDNQITAWMKQSSILGEEDTPEFKTFMSGLDSDERAAFSARADTILAKRKPHGAKKFFKTLGLIATLRFADAVEYLQNGDSEN